MYILKDGKPVFTEPKQLYRMGKLPVLIHDIYKDTGITQIVNVPLVTNINWSSVNYVDVDFEFIALRTGYGQFDVYFSTIGSSLYLFKMLTSPYGNDLYVSNLKDSNKISISGSKTNLRFILDKNSNEIKVLDRDNNFNEFDVKIDYNQFVKGISGNLMIAQNTLVAPTKIKMLAVY